MKKTLSLLVVLSLICVMLTGCVAGIYDTKINKDGSGVIKSFAGYTEESLKDFMESMEESGETGDDISEMDRYVYNDIVYLGEAETIEFSNADEFNEGMKGLFSETNFVKMVDNGNGALKLVIGLGDTDSSELESYQQEIEDYDDISMEEIMETLTIVFDFEFPENIVKTSGAECDGLVIDGNKLHFDLIKVAESLDNPAEVFTFETLKDGETVEDKILKFSDVSENQWFYHPVMTLANGGLVQGKGNGIFDPEGTLTYAEFCTILARVQGMEYGEEDGYWAAKAIKSCLDMGYINELGEGFVGIYDVPISREAAVAAMFRAVGYYTDEFTITEEDIPDFESIDEEFKEDIVYSYNYGITQGKDENMTFDPKGTLTRAEVCQLFYNVGCVVGY